MTITGSCLCGEIHYSINQNIGDVIHCHCIKCRKAHGSAFSSVAKIEDQKFSLSDASQHLKSYQSSEGKYRHFCSNCGSPLYSQRTDMPDMLRLRVGTVTMGQIPNPDYQIFCESQADWLVLSDNKPRYQQNIE